MLGPRTCGRCAKARPSVFKHFMTLWNGKSHLGSLPFKANSWQLRLAENPEHQTSNVGSTVESLLKHAGLEPISEQLFACGLQSLDDYLCETFHQFIAKVMIPFGAD